MTSEIRQATDADVPALVRIYNDLGVATTASYDLEPLSVEDRRRWLADHDAHGWPVLVAVSDGEVVGYATYGRFREKPGYDFTVEHSVYVLPQAQRGGVGRALMSELITYARRQGMHAMVGVIDADNAVSLAFHQSLGFANEGVLHQVGRKFGRWLDIALVVRVLE
mgnify:CR=1 FL=1